MKILHVVPEAWGAFTDVRATLNAVSRDWGDNMQVTSVREFLEEQQSVFSRPDTFVLYWGAEPIEFPMPLDRSAGLGWYFAEAIGPDDVKLENQRHHWTNFMRTVERFDAVFTYSPLAQQAIQAAELRAYLYPLGWHPETAGKPRWGLHKEIHYVHWGSRAGRRKLLVPYLAERLGSLFTDVSGSFGRSLTGVLDRSRAALTIAHTDVRTFAQWRGWQMLSSSAASIVEKTEETWPFLERHMFVVPRMDFNNVDEVAAELQRWSNGKRFEEVARRAFLDLHEEYHATECARRWLAPAIADVMKRRGGRVGSSEEES